MSTAFDDASDTIYAKIGSIAPDFKLKATNGHEIALSDFRGRNNVVLFFIREHY
jgi:peroxiredoxin